VSCVSSVEDGRFATQWPYGEAVGSPDAGAGMDLCAHAATFALILRLNPERALTFLLPLGPTRRSCEAARIWCMRGHNRSRDLVKPYDPRSSLTR
jgi:hypothetical protein